MKKQFWKKPVITNDSEKPLNIKHMSEVLIKFHHREIPIVNKLIHQLAELDSIYALKAMNSVSNIPYTMMYIRQDKRIDSKINDSSSSICIKQWEKGIRMDYILMKPELYTCSVDNPHNLFYTFEDWLTFVTPMVDCYHRVLTHIEDTMKQDIREMIPNFGYYNRHELKKWYDEVNSAESDSAKIRENMPDYMKKIIMDMGLGKYLK